MRWRDCKTNNPPVTYGDSPLYTKGPFVKGDLYMKATGDVASAHGVRDSERKEATRSTIAPR